MFDTNEVSNYILNMANENDLNITQLQIHKIMFFLQLKNISEQNELLFNEEFKAWKHGPVLMSQRNRFRTYGSRVINEKNLHVSSECEQYLEGNNDFILKLAKLNVWSLVESSHRNIFWKKHVAISGNIKNSELLSYYGS